MTAPRVMRAIWGQPNTPRTTTTVNTLRCEAKTCITTMAARTSGIAKKMSVMRDRTESNHLP